LLVTAMLSEEVTWRWAFGVMAVAQTALALLLALTRRAWHTDPCYVSRSTPNPSELSPKPAREAAPRRPPSSIALLALTFAAVETGIEASAGIWGYVFLTAGRSLSPPAAGVAVSAYWLTMFAGRAVLGPMAENVGPARVLGWAVAGVALGGALMTAPGPGYLAIIGMMIVGVAAAPVFPLFTLATAQRPGTGAVAKPTRMVSLQVAASAIGGAALPAGIGLAIGALSARVLAPSLLTLGLAMCGIYALLSRLPRTVSTVR